MTGLVKAVGGACDRADEGRGRGRSGEGRGRG